MATYHIEAIISVNREAHPGASRKGEGVELTKEQLEEYRQQGYSYEQIAEATGYSQKSVTYYLRKYGLTKSNHFTDEEKALFCELRRQGKTIEEIAEISGRSRPGVYGFLKKEGLGRVPAQKNDSEEDEEAESIVFTPVVVRYAEERKPQAVRCIADGKVWWDVSDFWIPR